ncbi:MAG: hypothetical protein ACMXYG_03475 [Candidatus Woesearchaeota archaeon]
MNSFLSKKSETNTFFIIIITLIVTAMIVGIGTITIRNIIGTVEDVEIIKFVETLESDIKLMAVKRGSAIYEYQLPERIDSLIFIDKTNKRALLNNDFIKRNPIIYDSIESGQNRNIFLFDRMGNLVNSFYIGEINVGQFGNQICTGVGFLNSTFGRINIRITNQPGVGITLGDECKDMDCFLFQGPFRDNIIENIQGFPRVKIIGNRYVIQLAENQARTTPENIIYFSNGSINTTAWDLSSNTYSADRIYFSSRDEGESKVLYRIGFQEIAGYWHFFGPNLTANSDEEDYYYTYSGQYITEPSWEYKAIKANIEFQSDYHNTTTSSFDWLRLCYFPKTNTIP